jgi:hypothetical protein
MWSERTALSSADKTRDSISCDLLFKNTNPSALNLLIGFVFDVLISGSNVILRANVTSGTWTIKVGTRIIF